MAKQNEVTAASMVRRARAHGKLWKEHRSAAVLGVRRGVPACEVAVERACALMHNESAQILRDEAKEIRSHR